MVTLLDGVKSRRRDLFGGSNHWGHVLGGIHLALALSYIPVSRFIPPQVCHEVNSFVHSTHLLPCSA